MKTKGYIVKGIGRLSGRTLWAMCESLGLADTREAAATFDGVGEAIEAMAQLHACRDVRILAVAEDGSETPIPTYEEALALLEETRAQTCTPMALADLPTFMQRMLSESVELGHELERLRAERDAERKAWARYVDAAQDVFLMAIGSMGDGRDVAPCRAKRAAAKDALRALGVDVDALAKEASGR